MFDDSYNVSCRFMMTTCLYRLETTRGTIEEIQLGDVMAHVVVRIGDNLIESVITRRSADELKLKQGDSVSAVVKATEVMIQKD
jgi:molybdopterin-binding protein